GNETQYGYTRLETLLDLCRDKIILDVDKNFEWFDQIWPYIEGAKMDQQVTLKGPAARRGPPEDYTATKLLSIPQYKNFIKRALYAPVIYASAPLTNTQYKAVMDGFIDNNFNVIAWQTTMDNLDNPVYTPINLIQYLQDLDFRTWQFAPWPEGPEG